MDRSAGHFLTVYGVLLRFSRIRAVGTHPHRGQIRIPQTRCRLQLRRLAEFVSDPFSA